ncbi:transglutaminase domain-containing protein [Nocardia sp. BMG51109]|uniref:transglutaminase domain-containing protein n=1 Tax=Nocardia sp. BMG51109 TaxID=1056816 RepID=UPI0004677AD0|nr:transglutaminase domain-containing protein [Nocardia sp. BMG51109]
MSDDLTSRAADVFERLCEIESFFDDFTVTPGIASSYGFDESALRDLENKGIRYERVDGVKVYSRKMLRTLSLYLDMKSPHVLAMRYWLRTAARLHASGELRVAITLQANIADEYAADPEIIRAWRPDGTVGRPIFDGDFVSAEHVVRLAGREGRPTSPGRALLDRYEDLRYVYLPECLEQDIEIFEGLRLANCRSFAYHLERLSNANGIESRVSTGLLVAIPYCTQHSWLEFRSGGDWVPVEPLLAALIASRGENEPRDHIERRLVGLFTRWGDVHRSFFQPADSFYELRATARVLTSPSGD